MEGTWVGPHPPLNIRHVIIDQLTVGMFHILQRIRFIPLSKEPHKLNFNLTNMWDKNEDTRILFTI